MAPLVRRNQEFLTTAEKQTYVTALLELKAAGDYDWYINTHIQAAAEQVVHGFPSFLPWHRVFVSYLERDLQQTRPTLTIPYWDWTRADDPKTSVWSETFMGPGGIPVTKGLFAWEPTHRWRCIGPNTGPALGRSLGNTPGQPSTLPTAEHVAYCNAWNIYDRSPWDPTATSVFRAAIEGWIPPDRLPAMHNRVHRWMGGNMADFGAAPNDPVFFLHHANIDRLWAQWQDKHPNAYQPTGEDPREGENIDDPMAVYTNPQVVIRSVLDTKAADLNYVYDTQRPSAQGPVMYPGDVLHRGESLWDPTHKFELTLQGTDGNLVLYDYTVTPRRAIWTAWTVSPETATCIMNFDGTLAVLDRSDATLWSRPRQGQVRGSRAYLTSSGTLDIRDLDGRVVWNSEQPAPVGADA
ncbi:tyrosinase family protein [Kitasatospora aureofaciens]|uniref:tyrosinase family protein n=1 Tax=Kitasatospora aureofaciens TaxID=1894 RepID=UPI001C49644B|nr:tyrosinase family protein [Kitasatospora aureofaciens]MBV6703312.1 tyrosinase family protein [Kitasatospora aureofaciens]